MADINISDLIDTEYKAYSMYTIENRAIPSMVDGFKPVQRKLYYAAIKEKADQKSVKVIDLACTLSRYGYLHGETSAATSLIGMAQTFQNNMPVFLKEGNFGCRLVPEAAAPRYITVMLSKNLFGDATVLKPRDGDNPEPLHYYPLVPMSLVNGSVGIAVGYATLIMPRSYKDISKALIAYSKGGDIKDIAPSLPEFEGDVVPNGAPNKWAILGKVCGSTSTRYIVEEIPWGITREQYLITLNSLYESGLIVDFSDECSSKPRFVVKVTREQGVEIDKNPIGYFSLSKLVTENYTLLDEHGRLKVYESYKQIIKEFFDYRVGVREEFIKHRMSVVTDKITKFEGKVMFVESVIKNRNLLTDLPLLEAEAERCGDAELISLPVSQFTETHKAKLTGAIAALEAENSRLKQLDPREDFIKDIS